MRNVLLAAAAIAAVTVSPHAGTAASRPAAAPEQAGAGSPFEGRYRQGPDVSPVRIVIFTDYQCPECEALDGVLEPILAEHPEFAISVKHFPFSNTCNPNLPPGQAGNMHPNACWAARAAEAAGILRGCDGFWAMHRWLFSRRGSFTDAELRTALAGMGYDAAEFERVMQSPETLNRVQADIAEGMSVGLFSTPMMFINGREVKNTRDPAAVRAAIDAAAEAGIIASAAEDRPPTVDEKIVADWKAQPRVRLVREPERWTGAAAEEATVTVVMWGDVLEPNSVRADAEIRRLMAATPGVRYAWMHFPTEQACNPAMPRTVHAGACAAAAFLEAAFVAGGADLAWRAHGALTRLTTQQKANLAGGADVAAVLRIAAPMDAEIAAQSEAILAAAAQGAQRVQADIAAAQAARLTGVPLIFINGRRVQRWTVGERPVLNLIVEAAARGE